MQITEIRRELDRAFQVHETVNGRGVKMTLDDIQTRTDLTVPQIMAGIRSLGRLASGRYDELTSAGTTSLRRIA